MYADAFTVLAATFDVDGIKKSFGTPLTLQTYALGSGLDGDLMAAMLSPRRAITFKTSSAVGAYNVKDPIVVSGRRRDNTPIESLVKLTLINGNETVETPGAFNWVDKVVVPAQLLNSGAIEIGVGAVEFETPVLGIEAPSGAGIVKVVTSLGEERDLTLAANVVREIAIRRVRRDNATTVTVYMAAA
ncbi:MAG: hypothetical protein HOW73_11800 [Polyangiaceae bacterium]|nr:hypothetical protein [Polyangiaceae bacterium]